MHECTTLTLTKQLGLAMVIIIKDSCNAVNTEMDAILTILLSAAPIFDIEGRP